MKRLLIVSDPPAAPGYLPRVRYICDYLIQHGYEVTWLTEEYQTLDFAHTYSIVTIPMYNGSTMDWTIKTLWTLLTNWHNRVFAQRAMKALAHQSFDAVLCSAFSEFPLGAAERIAKRMHIPLICDIRDLDEQVENSRYQYRHRTWWTMLGRRLYRYIHIRRRNHVFRVAQAITTVSQWHADFIRHFNKHTYVVYNGYDDKQFYPQDVPTDSFRITYIGSLFEWQQPALDKVRQIAEELHVTIDIHTPQNAPVPHNQLGDAIRQSSIMLVFTSTTTHGMLTTKFYEALGCAKPVLCIPSDQGELAELISYTNAGIATNDSEQIKAFILAKYNEWQTQGFTRQDVQHREEFAREAQCHILEKILQNHNK